MEAQTPVGRHVRSPNHLLILLDHCLGLRTKEKVEVEDTYTQMDRVLKSSQLKVQTNLIMIIYTSNDVVSECVGVQNHIHSITVPQKDTVSIATRTNLKIKGVRPVCV